MNRKFIIAAVLNILLIIIFSLTTTYADDCSLGRTPDGVYPMEDKDVVMVSEDIYCDVEKGLVECNFVFKNTGKAKDISMGFPAKMENNGDNTIEDKLYFKDFKTYLNDMEIPVNIEIGVKPTNLKDSTYPYYSKWYTFNVHFDAGETKHIRNTYKVDSTIYSTGDIRTGYILKTGAFWKDTIGYAKVTFDLGNIKPYEISRIIPFSMKYEGKNKLVWERSNFEPEFDLEIMYNTYFYDIEARQNEEYISNEYLNAAIDEIKEFEELDFLLDGMSKEELINLYNKYLDDEKVGIAKYIQSKIPDSVFNKKGPIIKKISYYNGFISCIAESDNRDYAYANLKVTHIENGEEIIDYNDSLDVFHLSGRSPIDQGMYFSFLPDIEYHIEYLIKDSYGNMDIKTLKYPSGLYVQNEASIPTSSEDNSNDTNIPLVDEEFTNNTSIPATDEVIENDTNISLPDIEYDDGTNKIKVSFSDDNSNQRNILPLAIALGILLLSAVLLLAFILQKRKQQRNNQTIK